MDTEIEIACVSHVLMFYRNKSTACLCGDTVLLAPTSIVSRY